MTKSYLVREAGKQLQKAIDTYNQTGNPKPLTKSLARLSLLMAEQIDYGAEVKFLDALPDIVDSLKSLDLRNGK